jgi:stearoyl-CoA desaturase (delta-9 desaturase)
LPIELEDSPSAAVAAVRRTPGPRYASTASPWKRSWFYCAPGEWKTLGWIALLHVAVIGGAFLISTPSWWIVLGSLAVIVLGGLGTTVAYHRSLAHGGVKLNPVIEHALIFIAMLNGSGKPLTWVANHRLHHATSDGEEDISSPVQGGFWWSHLRWLWQAGQAPTARYCGPLDRPAYRIWGKLQIPILALSFFGALPFGVTAWYWFGPLRLLWALHTQCTINSICHLDDPRSVGGSSRNVWWLAPFHFLQGENWHRNHHDDPTDARLGRTKAQIDLGWWAIVVLRCVGLAGTIRRSRSIPA